MYFVDNKKTREENIFLHLHICSSITNLKKSNVKIYTIQNHEKFIFNILFESACYYFLYKLTDNRHYITAIDVAMHCYCEQCCLKPIVGATMFISWQMYIAYLHLTYRRGLQQDDDGHRKMGTIYQTEVIRWVERIRTTSAVGKKNGML